MSKLLQGNQTNITAFSFDLWDYVENAHWGRIKDLEKASRIELIRKSIAETCKNWYEKECYPCTRQVLKRTKMSTCIYADNRRYIPTHVIITPGMKWEKKWWIWDERYLISSTEFKMCKMLFWTNISWPRQNWIRWKVTNICNKNR